MKCKYFNKNSMCIGCVSYETKNNDINISNPKEDLECNCVNKNEKYFNFALFSEDYLNVNNCEIIKVTEKLIIEKILTSQNKKILIKDN